MHGSKQMNLLLYYVPTASTYYTTTTTTIMPITYAQQQQQQPQQQQQKQNDIYNNSSSNPRNYFALSMWDLTSTTLSTTLTALSESLHSKNNITININSISNSNSNNFDVYERTTEMEGNTNIFDSLQTLAPTIGGHFKKLLNATNSNSNSIDTSEYNNLSGSTSSKWNQSSTMFLNATSSIINNITDYNSSNHIHNHGIGDINEISYIPYVMRPETYIVPVLFALIFIVGVLGNGTLVVVFLSVRQMRNVPNTYILSLALADLLVIVTTVPLTSTVYTVDTWPWGSFLCTLSEFIKDVSIGVSVFTLIALSADRYFAIVDPLRKFHAHGGGKRATHMTITIAVSIWILAMFCGLPSLLGTYIKEIKVNRHVSFSTCYPFPEKWGKPYAKTIVLLRFLVYYAIPLIIIGVFYVLIACHLMYSANVPGEMQGAIRQVRARRKVAVTVLSFVVIFGICFLPSHVFMLWFYYWPTAEEDYNSFWHVLRIVGFCLSFANSCANPVALYFVSGAFRKHFNRYLFCQDGGSRHIKRHCQRSDTLSMHRDMSLTSTNASTKRCYHRRSYHNHSTIRSRLAETETITVMPNDGTYHSDYQSEVTAVALDETLLRQSELKHQRFKCQQEDEAFM